MRTYGKSRVEENGFSVVEVLETNAAGVSVLIGYAILDPDGNEMGFFGSIDDALSEFQRITDDNKPSAGYSP